MNVSLDGFRSDMINEIKNNVMINHSNETEEFINYYIDQLIAAEEILEIDNYNIEVVGENRKKGRIDGYYYDSLDRSISLFIADYSNEYDTKNYTNTMVDTSLNKVVNFIDFVYLKHYIDYSEESSQEYQLASEMISKNELINKIKIFIFTDYILSKSIKDLQVKDYYQKKVSVNIWDVQRIYNLIGASYEREDLIVDIQEFGFDGIYCVEAMKSDLEVYSSYLAVIDGELLANLYIKYGPRLLEGNVRSFLSVRGKINKGIRNTIRDNPELFFAYNNGIVVTATDIELSSTKRGKLITKLINFQIINGGQTTASIANAVLQDKAIEKVKRIKIPMKLTVVNNEKANEMIPNIARFANSQNKVDESDFFSNSPYHVRIEELSRKIYAPPSNGAPYETVWFYERAKGQYVQEQMKLSSSEKKKYLILKPKRQLIRKIDLAKYIMTYNQFPHIVSRGNQYNMRLFAGEIEKKWKKDSSQFNNYYFKKAISLAIIFKETEKLVSNSLWYQNAYRANIVTYSLAIIFFEIDKQYSELELSFLRIWNEQSLYLELRSQLKTTTFEVFEYISNPPVIPGHTSMITEFCKREYCWEYAKKKDWTLNVDFIKTLVKKVDNETEMIIEKKSQRETELINLQTTVVNLGEQFWRKALSYGIKLKLLNETEASFISSATDFSKHVPSDKQCKMILKILDKLKEEGFK